MPARIELPVGVKAYVVDGDVVFGGSIDAVHIACRGEIELDSLFAVATKGRDLRRASTPCAGNTFNRFFRTCSRGYLELGLIVECQNEQKRFLVAHDGSTTPMVQVRSAFSARMTAGPFSNLPTAVQSQNAPLSLV